MARYNTHLFFPSRTQSSPSFSPHFFCGLSLPCFLPLSITPPSLRPTGPGMFCSVCSSAYSNVHFFFFILLEGSMFFEENTVYVWIFLTGQYRTEPQCINATLSWSLWSCCYPPWDSAGTFFNLCLATLRFQCENTFICICQTTFQFVPLFHFVVAVWMFSSAGFLTKDSWQMRKSDLSK